MSVMWVVDAHRLISAADFDRSLQVASRVYASSQCYVFFKGWQCPLCSKTCGSEQALNQHLGSSKHASGIRPLAFPCRECGRPFSKLSSLVQHAADVGHADELVFELVDDFLGLQGKLLYH